MRSVFFFNFFFDAAVAVAVDVLQLFYDTRPTTAPAETLRSAPSRLCAENPRDVAGLDVETVVQGATISGRGSSMCDARVTSRSGAAAQARRVVDN